MGNAVCQSMPIMQTRSGERYSQRPWGCPPKSLIYPYTMGSEQCRRSERLQVKNGHWNEAPCGWCPFIDQIPECSDDDEVGARGLNKGNAVKVSSGVRLCLFLW